MTAKAFEDKTEDPRCGMAAITTGTCYLEHGANGTCTTGGQNGSLRSLSTLVEAGPPPVKTMNRFAPIASKEDTEYELPAESNKSSRDVPIEHLIVPSKRQIRRSKDAEWRRKHQRPKHEKKTTNSSRR